MTPIIPQSSQKRLLRLISARVDVESALAAFDCYSATTDEEVQYHFFASMVLAYCRPFTENFGIGSLLCEYPTYPDYADEEMNTRHRRMIDLRNTMLGHSSVQGTRVWLLGPGAVSPATGQIAAGFGYTVAKLSFHRPEYTTWLHALIVALSERLQSDMQAVLAEVGGAHLKQGESAELDTGKPPFQWTR